VSNLFLTECYKIFDEIKEDDDEITSETSEEDSDVEVIDINLEDDSIGEFGDKKLMNKSIKTKRFMKESSEGNHLP
jgi:hypothetical protein